MYLLKITICIGNIWVNRARRKDMKKRVMALILVIMIIGGIGFISKNVMIIDSASESVDTSYWKEIPIQEGTSFARCNGSIEFDLKETIMEADYIFSGIIVNRKEYEVEWTDANGQQWGPFPSSVIEAKITHEYYGKSQGKSDIIKIYYPYSLSTVFAGSFLLKEKEEYVFVTQALDEEFVEKRSKNAPNDKFQQEKHADVYISHPSYSIMSINNGTIFMHNKYFSWNKEVMSQIKTGKSVTLDTMSSPELIKNGWFIALDRKKFDKAFMKLLEEPKKLPSASEL